MIKLYAPAEIKETSKEGDNDVYEVMVSSGKVDRLGDTINPKGWYLANYKKNPVILWAHQSGGMFGTAIPPVGQATKTWLKDEKELWQKQIFAPTQLAQELKTLVDGQFLRAQSVGFMPLVEDEEKGSIEIEGKIYRQIFEEELRSYIEKGFVEIAGKKYSKGGEHFDKQELLEVSWVDVPALPTALVAARKMNLALMTKALEEKIGVGKPYPNEHSCRLKSPGDYKTCKRTTRTSDGKKYSILTCQRKDDSTKWEEQGYRYAKDVWTASEAKKHCTDHKGIKFEPASEKEKTTYECECLDCEHKMTSDKHCADIKCPKCGGEMRRVERPGPGKGIKEESEEDYDTCKCGSKEIETLHSYPAEGFTTATISIQRCKKCRRIRKIKGDAGNPMKLLGEIEIKEGRVISEKNRKLMNNCIKQMGEAIDALRGLLEATEPKKDITPIDNKGRSHRKVKDGRNPELHRLLLADKAIENVLRGLKKKSSQKAESRLLRIASKVIDIAIIKLR